jgi:hypothetical protein
MDTDKQKEGEVENESAEEVFFGFIPRRLEISWEPGFYNFPFNVMFAGQTVKGGKLVTRIALYEPDFHTYRKEENLSVMKYHNIYGGNCYLTISYNEQEKQYCGEKYVNGKLIGSTSVKNSWELFFSHFGILGLAPNEKSIELEEEK